MLIPIRNLPDYRADSHKMSVRSYQFELDTIKKKDRKKFYLCLSPKPDGIKIKLG